MTQTAAYCLMRFGSVRPVAVLATRRPKVRLTHGSGPAIRRLFHAPQLTVADPLAVRVAGFEKRFGLILIHYAEVSAHAETSPADVSDIADYIERYTTTQDGEVWIDGENSWARRLAMCQHRGEGRRPVPSD